MNRRHVRPARRLVAPEPLEPRALLASLATAAAASPVAATAGSPTADRLFVRFQPATPAAEVQALIGSVGGQLQTTYPDGQDLIRVAGPAAVAAATTALRSSPFVVSATADTTIHTEAAVYPNDPGFSQSPGLNSPNNVDIDAPEAWGVTTGSSSVIVAVLDTGLDLGDPDFAGRIWTNPNNDAAAGYPNDTHGWNFINNTPNVQDNDGHGTHVTSLLAAGGNNAYGIAGVAWNVQIMPLKFLDASGAGSTDAAVAAIEFAVNHGARVINASWGGVDFSQPLVDAISYANAHNVVFVTAAGNDGTDNDYYPSYPASFNLPNELSVTSVDSNGNLPYFANYGPSTVNIAAPGVNILGEYPTALSASGLQVLSGTSMSTAYVSGVAALLLSEHPEYTASQVVQTIDATAKPLPSLAGRIISGGMVDAYNALTASSVGTTATPVTTTATGAGTLTDAQLQGIILASPEFYSSSGGTSTSFVTGLYNILLDRTPDAGGLAYWVNQEDTGAASRTTIAAAILNSAEGRATEVARLYQADLGRTTPLATLKVDPGVQLWAGLLTQGATPEAVEAQILGSPEYVAAHGTAAAPVVASWYDSILGRDADAGGLAFWAAELDAGTPPITVVQQLEGSAEARQTRVARYFMQYLGRTANLATLKTDAGVDALAAELVS